MNETTPRVKVQLPANMTALHRQLEEMAARSKRPTSAPNSQKNLQGPVLIIRGK
jgi:hypothetical protein